MNYRRLGKAGIRVSELSLGPWLTFSKHLSIKKARKMVALAFDNGINTFDNAERYAEGMAECLMGEVLRSFRRESLVITTKLYWGGEGPNDVGLSHKHLYEGIKNSLRRLQLDYVDLLFCHRPDPHTLVEETVLAMDAIVRRGYALYWGTSEWTASQIEIACQLAEKMHCIPPSMEQAEYNLFNRQRVEEEYCALFQKNGLGLMTWSPLASGILAGKYSNGMPSEARLFREQRLITEDFSERVAKADKLKELALELDCTPAQLSIAWCLANNNVSSVIIGASSEEQLLENIAATQIQLKISQEIQIALDGIFVINSQGIGKLSLEI